LSLTLNWILRVTELSIFSSSGVSAETIWNLAAGIPRYLRLLALNRRAAAQDKNAANKDKTILTFA
jgi:hypothetical protein